MKFMDLKNYMIGYYKGGHYLILFYIYKILIYNNWKLRIEYENYELNMKILIRQSKLMDAMFFL